MIAAMLGCAVALRLALLVLLYGGGFTALTADDFARVVVAARWAEDGAHVTHGPWPPLQFWILGTALRVDWDLVWTPRAVAIVAGLIAIPLAYAIAARLGGRAAGCIAALALAASPSHVWLGATPLSEGLYGTLWLGAVLAAMRWTETRRGAALLVAALLLAAADGVRLEGWIVSALFVVLVLWRMLVDTRAGAGLRRRDVTTAVLAVVIVAAVPIAWTVSDARASGTVLGFLREIERYKADFATRGRAFPAGPGTWAHVVVALDPSLVPAALAGAITLLRARRRAAGLDAYATLGCAPLAVFLVMQHGEPDPWINHLRYAAPFLWMLLPLAACGVVAIARALVPPRRLAPALAAACAALIAFQSWRALDPPRDASGAGVALGRALAALRDPTDPGAVLLDAGGFDAFAVHAGLGDVRHVLYETPLDRRRSSAVYAALGDAWAEPWSGGCADPGDDEPALLRCARAHDVRWIARRSGGAHVAADSPGLAPRAEVAGWTIYAVPPATTLAARSEVAP